jgi:hypothetical protein
LLDEAQLQGADLEGAQLQGASLYNTQLQGAVLVSGSPLDARLEGAQLRHTYVWRTQPPPNLNGALVSAPEPGPEYVHLDCPAGECDWSETSYATLKSLIEHSVPAPRRYQALLNIATLEKPPYVAYEVWAKAWGDLADGSANLAGSYFNTLAKNIDGDRLRRRRSPFCDRCPDSAIAPL